MCAVITSSESSTVPAVMHGQLGLGKIVQVRSPTALAAGLSAYAEIGQPVLSQRLRPQFGINHLTGIDAADRALGALITAEMERAPQEHHRANR